MFRRYTPGTPEFAHFFPELAQSAGAWVPWVMPQPVETRHLPGLRALIKHLFPRASPHEQNAIVEEARGSMGGVFTGGNTALDEARKKLFGENVPTFGTQEEYSNAINVLSRNPTVKKYLEYYKDAAMRKLPQGSYGHDQPSNEVQAHFRGAATPGFIGKQTLGAHFIQPGADVLDQTIQQKVQSQVDADYFNYVPPNAENGVYNALYLNDVQWEKEIRFHDNGEILPRSANDQVYFPGWEVPWQYRNTQNVMSELSDQFERKVYELEVQNDSDINFERDSKTMYDPVSGKEFRSYLVNALSLKGDKSMPYEDPDGVNGIYASDLNAVGLRPAEDTWKWPYGRSRFLPVRPTMDKEMALAFVAQRGAAGYSLP